eukprot:GILI01002439.1.p1 GENE.GILI01002439.1~~GILI01002439.1.p1  ORF type:complete len:167 (+),score=53.42 GILI01002439.1:67-501(+)
MIRKSSVLFVCALLLVAVSAQNDLLKIVRLPITGGESTLEATQGEEFRVTLEGNPTTGYLWKFLADESMAAVLGATLPEPVFLPSNGGLGAPGLFEFKFRPVQTGSVVLKFAYVRPWEVQEVNAPLPQGSSLATVKVEVLASDH